MNTLYLIPCCATKEVGGYKKATPNIELSHRLSSESYELLLEKRNEVKANSQFTLCNVNIGADFGGSEPACYLPAIQRYKGNLYVLEKKSAVKPKDVLQRLDFVNHQVLIISALYGLLHPLDDIQDYELIMPKTKKSTWFKYLPKILEDYISINKINEVHTFFGKSTGYHSVVHNLFCDDSNIFSKIKDVKHFPYYPPEGVAGSSNISKWHGKKLIEVLKKNNAIS